MQFENNFDLEDIIAYLLPGALFLSSQLAFGYTYGIVLTFPFKGASDLLVGFILLTSFISISLILGHAFSIFTRYVLRKIMDGIFGDPEVAILETRDRFFTAELTAIIGKRFKTLFGSDIQLPGLRPAVPRLIRSVVFNHSENAVSSRERIVRSRSICANFVTPLILIAITAPASMPWPTRIVVLLLSAALLVKQRDLDTREAKEIYLAFIAITNR